jgi:photosystem II stability/assembly factor-like uncharacterized protein
LYFSDVFYSYNPYDKGKKMKAKLLSIVTIFLLLFTFNNMAQDYQDFKFMHPKPQANMLSEIKMFDLNNWVATGQNGTFMKTTNGGVDWYFHHQAGKVYNNAEAIGHNYDFWFFNSSTGIVVGETGYIGKTTNGGITFQAIDNGIIPTTQRGTSVWFADQNIGYVTSGSGQGFNGTVVKTTDGGATWSNILTLGYSVLAITGTDAQTVYAVASDGTVHKTTNGGTNWTSTLSVGIYMYDISFLNATTGLICGSQGGLFRTTNSGTTWEALTPPQVDWAFNQVKIVSATEIYLVGDPVYLWKSTNLGTTWTSLPIMPVSGPASTYIWQSMDKQGSVMAMCGDFGVVAKSTDNGASWFSNHFSYSTQIMFDITTVPGSQNVWAVGRQYLGSGDRNVMFSSDGGTNWVTYNTNVVTDLYAISMVSPKVGYVCGTNSVVLKTTDAGQSWTAVTKPSTTINYNLYAMEFINENTGWVFINYAPVSVDGNIFKTTDGGNSWTQQTIGNTNGIAGADMVNANVGYLCLNPSGNPIYKTTNGGTTWTPVPIPLSGNIKGIKAIDENTVYIGSSFGTNRVAKTTDGGTTWTPFALPAAVDVTSLDFKDASTGYVCGNLTSAVCRTTNGGTTWSVQNVHLPTLAKLHVSAGDTVFVSGTYTSILRSTNFVVPVELASFTSTTISSDVQLNWSTATEKNNMGFDIERCQKSNVHGQTEWEKMGFVEGNGTSTEIHSYSFTDKNLTPGNYSYRLKQIDFDGAYKFYKLSEDVGIGLPSKFELSQNYPNPFNPATTIRFSLAKESKTKLQIFNSIGELVATLIDELKPAGNYDVTFDASKLTSGMYLYKLSTDYGTFVKKMILIK